MKPSGGWQGPKKVDRAGMRRVSGLFKPYGKEISLVVALVLGSAALGLLPPFYLRHIVNEGIQQRNLDAVMHYSSLTIAVVLISVLLGLGYGYVSTLVGQRIMRDLRNQLYAHLQGMSLRFFTGTRTGEIQSRLANDVGGIQSVVSDTAAGVLSNLTILISTLVAMFVLDWRLAILSVGIVPLFAFLGFRVGEFARKYRTVAQEQLADLNSTMNETLSVSGVLLTKTSGRQALALENFSRSNHLLTNTSIRISMIMRVFFNMIMLTFQLTPILVYWFAGYLIAGKHDTSLNLGTIVAFTALQGRVFFPLQGLLNVQVELGSAMALFDRIFEYLDLKQEVVDAPDAVDLDPATMRGEVVFKDVSFRYEATQAEPTLDDISLRANPGQLVALVGASGAGKTTLTYLIPRLYDAESGEILIDGVEVKKIHLASLGRFIAVVTQETYLVHDTIRENLRYGNPDAAEEELVAAAKAAAIHDHIASLPEGYDTVVGERGYKLSGGEKQRVSIARAILKNPRILILDEATSALDTQSERLIQAALEPLMQGRTTFAVAHRLSTIRMADQILVMGKGKILERGTHDQLIELDGEYRRLYELQFGEEGDAQPVATGAK